MFRLVRRLAYSVAVTIAAVWIRQRLQLYTLAALIAVAAVILTLPAAAAAAPEPDTTTTTTTTVADVAAGDPLVEATTTTTSVVPYTNGVPTGCPGSGVAGPAPQGVICPPVTTVAPDTVPAAVGDGVDMLFPTADLGGLRPTLFESTGPDDWAWTTDYGIRDTNLVAGNAAVQITWTVVGFSTQVVLHVYNWILGFNPADIVSADWASTTAAQLMPILWALAGLAAALLGIRALIAFRQGRAIGGFMIIAKAILAAAVTTLIAYNPAQLFEVTEQATNELLAAATQTAAVGDSAYYAPFPNMTPTFGNDPADTVRRDTVDRLHHVTIRVPWALGQFGSWERIVTPQTLDLTNFAAVAAAESVDVDATQPLYIGELFLDLRTRGAAIDIFKDAYPEAKDWPNGKNNSSRQMIVWTSMAVTFAVGIIILAITFALLGAYLGALLLIAVSGLACAAALFHPRGMTLFARWLSLLFWQLGKRLVFILGLRLIVDLMAAILMDATPSAVSTPSAATGDVPFGMILAAVMLWAVVIVAYFLRKQFVTILGQLAVPGLTPSSGNGAVAAAASGAIVAASGAAGGPGAAMAARAATSAVANKPAAATTGADTTPPGGGVDRPADGSGEKITAPPGGERTPPLADPFTTTPQGEAYPNAGDPLPEPGTYHGTRLTDAPTGAASTGQQAEPNSADRTPDASPTPGGDASGMATGDASATDTTPPEPDRTLFERIQPALPAIVAARAIASTSQHRLEQSTKPLYIDGQNPAPKRPVIDDALLGAATQPRKTTPPAAAPGPAGDHATSSASTPPAVPTSQPDHLWVPNSGGYWNDTYTYGESRPIIPAAPANYPGTNDQWNKISHTQQQSWWDGDATGAAAAPSDRGDQNLGITDLAARQQTSHDDTDWWAGTKPEPTPDVEVDTFGSTSALEHDLRAYDADLADELADGGDRR